MVCGCSVIDIPEKTQGPLVELPYDLRSPVSENDLPTTLADAHLARVLSSQRMTMDKPLELGTP